MDEHRRAQRAVGAGGRLVRPARRAQGREPVSVTLVRRWRGLLPPGPGPSRGEWQEYPFYTYEVAGAQEAAARDEGARDLGAVLVQGRRDVHPRHLRIAFALVVVAWTISSPRRCTRSTGTTASSRATPTPHSAPGASSSSTRARPPSRSSTCCSSWARCVSRSASRRASRPWSSSSAWSRSPAGTRGC